MKRGPVQKDRVRARTCEYVCGEERGGEEAHALPHLLARPQPFKALKATLTEATTLRPSTAKRHKPLDDLQQWRW